MSILSTFDTHVLEPLNYNEYFICSFLCFLRHLLLYISKPVAFRKFSALFNKKTSNDRELDKLLYVKLFPPFFGSKVTANEFFLQRHF